MNFNIFEKLQKQVKRTKIRHTKRAEAQTLSDTYFKTQAGEIRVASVHSGVVTLETTASALFQEIEGFHKQELLKHLRDGGMHVSEIRARLASP